MHGLFKRFNVNFRAYVRLHILNRTREKSKRKRKRNVKDKNWNRDAAIVWAKYFSVNLRTCISSCSLRLVSAILLILKRTKNRASFGSVLFVLLFFFSSCERIRNASQSERICCGCDTKNMIVHSIFFQHVSEFFHMSLRICMRHLIVNSCFSIFIKVEKYKIAITFSFWQIINFI